MSTLTGASRVTLRELRSRVETSDGADEMIIGRVDTGEFVALPPVAGTVLELLRTGRTLDETRAAIRADTGRDIDVASFVGSLINLGFVAAVDNRPVPDQPPRATLPQITAAHLRWLLTWPVLGGYAVVLLAGAVALAARPELLPNYQDLLWTSQTSLVMVANVIIGWSIIWLHEIAHLLTARAAGVPGRITLSTRLQFLAAQTDVSGVWASPRWQRMVVYLSGIAVNLGVAAVAVLLRVLLGEESVAGRLCAAATTISLLMIAVQFLVFMRTDIYFVLQDLTRCRNLYADGSAYVRWWLRRGIGRAGPDPSVTLRPSERRAVRSYAVVVFFGTALCLTVAAVVMVPFVVSVLIAAGAGVTGGGSAERIDGLITLIVVGGYWVLWCRLWWRRHGHRIHAWRSRALRLPRTGRR